MRRRTRKGLRRRIAVGLAAVMVGTLIQQGTTVTAEASDRGRPAAVDPDRPVAGHALEAEPRGTGKASRTPEGKPEAAWPRGRSAMLAVPRTGAKGTSGKDTGPTDADGLPVSVTAPKGGGKAGSEAKAKAEAAPEPVEKINLKVHDRKTAERAGVDGLLFSVARADGAGERGAVGIRLDYADFAEAYGANYGARLRLVELPSCALATPAAAKCRDTVEIPAINDANGQTLTAASLTVGSANSSPTLLAAVSGTSSDQGDFTATSLSPSATWSTNLPSGDFSWSYGMPVPDVPGSLKPDVGLSYSSGSIDGRTGTTNNQSSWIGDGFDLWPGFIERRYKSCADDGIKIDGNDPGDLCWGYDNATISFNGKGGELVPVGNGVWKLKDDDGTKIERLEGTSRDNGDDNEEYWRLTTTDGTRYYFGYHKLPGWADGKGTTDSTWTVPVHGDDAGEPCHGSSFIDSWCQQAWRWNLDYVVDVHGNAMAYYYDKETNHYGRALKPANGTPYVRGGHLDRIEYGLKSSAMYADKALAKVDFTSAERCIPETGVTCEPDTIDDKSFYWYDTPWDQNCKSGTDCTTSLAPTFWTRKRLTDVTTQILKSDGTYTDVDTWKLAQRWGMADIDYSLLLESVQHTGKSAATAITLPKVSFAYHQDANRLDKADDDTAPFIKHRLATVADESGGQIDVNYSAPACDWNALPTPQSNTTRCYPQYMELGSENPVTHWFNKYVVTSVTATDRTGGAPDEVTQYSYLDGAAWHFDDDDGLTKEKYKTWSTWRGYGRVRVKTGGQSGTMLSQEDHYYLRGMDGDRAGPDGGTKSVTVPDGEGTTLTDHAAYAGFEYRTEKYSAPGGKILEKSVNHPWSHETAKRVRSWGTITANLTGTATSKRFVSLDDGAGSSWRTTATATTYDTVAGRAAEVNDYGDTTTAADNRCTRITYADNTDKRILDKPSRVETVAVKCAEIPNRATDVISDVRTAYDGGAYGAAPTKGDATTIGTLSKHDGSKATYTESSVTFDGYGRALTATDLSGTTVFDAAGTSAHTDEANKRTTTTVYTPATGLPTQKKVTTPPAKAGTSGTAQTTTTTLDPARGLPLTVLDTNNKRTDYAYDALGRRAAIWLPNRSKANGQTPNYAFTYKTEEGAPAAVGTKWLGSGGAQLTSYTLYDGFLRPRQTQAPGPDGGRLVSDTFYDERGLTKKVFAQYYTTGAPSTTLFGPDDSLSVETQTHFTYDGLGRTTVEKQIAGNGDGGTELAVTTTTYKGDRTTIDPPDGSTPTTRVTDARGQITELWHYRGGTPEGDHDTTRYSYTPAGQIARVVDAAGNTWSYLYDQRGLLTESNDPDKGKIALSHDDYGLLISTSNDRGGKLYHSYDDLGRKTETREGAAGGTLLAQWTYDPLGAKGQLASATRYVGGNAYKTTVNIYDSLYRPNRTTVTIPASEGALAGSYQINTKYNADETVQSVSYPAAGSLPAEVVTPTYDSMQRPVTLGGASTYVTDTVYSNTGKLLQHELASGGKKTWVTNTYEWGTQRLKTSRTDREDVAGVDRHATYGYDQAGNVRSVVDTSREGTDAQCFVYDHLRRLTEAWAQSNSQCASQPSASVLGGPAPYWTTYGYDKTGNRTEEIQHDILGDTTNDVRRTYTYPAPGSPRPHALTKVETTGPGGTQLDTFTYDATGNTTDRELHGTDQELTWDAEGRLTKVVETTEQGQKTTSYVYDADGKRLIQDHDGTRTLYLGNTEITLAKGSTIPKATRYYDIGAGTAIRTDDNKVSFLVGDHHGTAELAISAADLSMQQRRTTPFGGYRGTQPTNWPGTKGFLGGTEDGTGLTHLGAREYDSDTGRFISVDPVMDLGDPQQMNGYAYAGNNPLTFSDPDGLRCLHGAPGGGKDGICAGVSGDTDGVINGTSNNCPRTSSCYDAAVEMSQHARKIGSYGKTPRQYKKWLNDGRKAREIYRCGFVGCDGQVANPAAWCYRNAELCTIFHLAYELEPVLHKVWEVEKELLGLGGLEACAAGDMDACVDLTIDVTVASKMRLAGRLLGLCKALNSFVAGTEVLLADGSRKKIEDVRTGDKVLATDPETGETTAREVVATIITEDDKRFTELKVTADDGHASIVTTDHHPFWSPSKQAWLDAADLKPGMTLRTPDGDLVAILGARHFTDRRLTYNLTVDDVHTYYVAAGEESVLVHNGGEDIGLTREQHVAQLLGGTVAKGPNGQDIKITMPNVGSSGLDVISADGDYVFVGGPAKAKNPSKFGQALKINKYAADQAGVRAIYYFEEGTPESALKQARKVFGAENVHTFSMHKGPTTDGGC
ncbi:polymorphic toxin-type HINT domain-containing protein [Streptomyces atacamensis]|uniref:polymorphic toxin-type HINT domain-containing protein n=1 Tax=Streptomyces atacamensis TaxID=531966 RepID=UPI00399C54BF